MEILRKRNSTVQSTELNKGTELKRKGVHFCTWGQNCNLVSFFCMWLSNFPSPKQYTDLIQSPKIPMSFLKEIEQKNCQDCMEPQNTPNNKSNLEKKEQSQKYHTT